MKILLCLLAASALTSAAHGLQNAPATPPDNGGQAFAFIVLCILGFVAYMLPSLVAMYRNVARQGGIQVLNFCLGWTFLFWIIALIWACSAETKAEVRAKEFDYDKLAAAITARDRQS